MTWAGPARQQSMWGAPDSKISLLCDLDYQHPSCTSGKVSRTAAFIVRAVGLRGFPASRSTAGSGCRGHGCSLALRTCRAPYPAFHQHDRAIEETIIVEHEVPPCTSCVLYGSSSWMATGSTGPPIIWTAPACQPILLSNQLGPWLLTACRSILLSDCVHLPEVLRLPSPTWWSPSGSYDRNCVMSMSILK